VIVSDGHDQHRKELAGWNTIKRVVSLGTGGMFALMNVLSDEGVALDRALDTAAAMTTEKKDSGLDGVDGESMDSS
jgi:hypothetical protein